MIDNTMWKIKTRDFKPRGLLKSMNTIQKNNITLKYIRDKSLKFSDFQRIFGPINLSNFSMKNKFAIFLLTF